MSRHPATPAGRSADLRVAGLHVRGGSYGLARAELEALAGADRLDADGILDLAAVRWRTGDLAGAAAAAAAWLEEAPAGPGPGSCLANVICAEAAAERGDPESAAPFLAAAVPDLGDGAALAALLAGIAPRAAWPWPAGGAAGDRAQTGVPAGDDPVPAPPIVPPAAAGAGPAGGDDVPEPTPAAGAGAAAAGGEAGAAGRAPVAPAAADLLAAGIARLGTEPDRAAVLLALALRADRAAAEAVLAALDAQAAAGPVAGETGRPATSDTAALTFVRAEALRAAGRHDDARIAYASAERLALAPAEAGLPGSPQ